VLEAVSAGDPDGVLAAMQENWVPAEEGSDRESRWKRIARMLTQRHAGLEIVGVLVERRDELVVVTQDPDGMRLRFGFEFEAESPHRVVSMSVDADDSRGGRPELPAFQVPSDADEAAIVAALGAWFDALAERELFSGAALVAWHGQALFNGAWGLASREWNVPNRVDTRFDLGSINKSFTQIAIGQLASARKLSLDDTIADHLPDYPNGDVARKVTIRHLLEHTSGLGDIFTDEYFRSSKALYRSPADFFPLFASAPLQFDPGTRSAYSNAGYMVLGAIIEAASGETYDAYVVRHLFQPAGMADSGFFAKDEPVPNVAVGYTRHAPDGTGELRNNLFRLPIRGNSAGSALSTVEDLLRFDNALREHRLLPPPWTRWYFGGDEPSTSESQQSERAMAASGIAGGAPGVSAVLESDADLALIVLANGDPPITESIARTLFRPLGRALSGN
jgi:CubicO group peptidase (beta-lactamase class C family)